MRKIKKYRFALYLMVLQLLPIPGRSQGIEITPGGTISVTSAATFELNNQGFVNNGAYSKGTETITFSGTASKTISGSSNTEIYNLSVTNTGGITTQLDLLTTNNLSIASGSKFTIDAGKVVQATGTLTNSAGNEGLVIKSTSDAANGSGSLINSTSGVSATVERWMSGDLWHLISPAATGGETVAQFVGATQNSNLIARNSANFGLATYTENDDTWDYYKISGANTSGQFGYPGEGYQILRMLESGTGKGNPAYDGAVSFKGTLAAGNKSIGIANSHNGWNLIGNPYPCAMNVDEFLDANSASIDTGYLAIYVSTIEDVVTYGYTAINYSSNFRLSSGEGFFVKSAGTKTVNFTPAMKSATSDAFKSATIEYPTIKLMVETETEKMSTIVRYVDGMTNGLDPGWDAGLFNNGPTPLSVFTHLVNDNGTDFAIQCLPDNNYENLVVPVGLVAAKGTSVTFKALTTNFPQDYSVYLEDRNTGSFYCLDDLDKGYTLILNENSKGTGRFYLYTSHGEPDIPAEWYKNLKFVALPQQQIIRISGTVNLPAKAVIYDITGRIISSQSLLDLEENDIQLLNANSGIYLLKIESNMNQFTEKIRWINNN